MDNIRRRWLDEVGKSDLLSSVALEMVDSSNGVRCLIRTLGEESTGDIDFKNSQLVFIYIK
jgi:hypothetical protein